MRCPAGNQAFARLREAVTMSSQATATTAETIKGVQSAVLTAMSAPKRLTDSESPAA